MLVPFQVTILMIASNLVLAVDNSSMAKAILQAKMTSDFVVFGHFRRVCLIKGTNSGSMEDRLDSQGLIKMIFVRLYEQQTAYLSVLNPDADTLIHENEKHYLLPHHHLNNPSYLRSYTNDLFIHSFRTVADYATFKKVFQDYGREATWLLLAEDNYLEMLSQMHLPLDNKVIIALLNVETDSANFSEVYQVAPHLQMRISTLGHWFHKSSKTTSAIKRMRRYRRRQLTSSGNIKVRSLRFGVMNATTGDFVRERTDLTGLHLECSTLEEEPYVVLLKREDGTVDIGGFVGKIYSHLQNTTNMTTTCRRSKDGKYGGLSHGKWTGVVREVKDGEADIGVASLSITHERSTAVDYLMGIHKVTANVFIKRPTTNDYIWTVYTKQFSLYVWLLLLVLLISMVSLLYFSARILNEYPLSSVSEAALTVFGFFLGQGTTNDITCVTIRIMAFLALSIHLLMLSHYTSDMVSALAAGPRLPTISSFEDIANNPELHFAVIEGTANEAQFRNAAEGSRLKIWQKIKSRNFKDLMGTFKEGFRGLQAGKHLFYTVRDRIFGMPPEEGCTAYALPGISYITHFSFILSKGSPLVPILNKVLMDARAIGLIDKWAHIWLPEEQDCTALETSAIKLQTVGVPFLILGSALLVSLITLVLEKYMKPSQRNQRKRMTSR